MLKPGVSLKGRTRAAEHRQDQVSGSDIPGIPRENTPGTIEGTM